MEDGKKSFKENIADDLACTAFAEASEPCPIGEGQEKESVAESDRVKPELKSVEVDLACTAFAEAGEPCPIKKDDK